jgi:hypothetical protein
VVPPLVPPLAGSSSSEGSQRVNQPQVVDASSSPPKYEAFEATFGSLLVVFPTFPVRGASSLAAPDRHFGVPCGLLQSARGAVVEVMCTRD